MLFLETLEAFELEESPRLSGLSTDESDDGRRFLTRRVEGEGTLKG